MWFGSFSNIKCENSSVRLRHTSLTFFDCKLDNPTLCQNLRSIHFNLVETTTRTEIQFGLAKISFCSNFGHIIGNRTNTLWNSAAAHTIFTSFLLQSHNQIQNIIEQWANIWVDFPFYSIGICLLLAWSIKLTFKCTMPLKCIPIIDSVMCMCVWRGKIKPKIIALYCQLFMFDRSCFFIFAIWFSALQATPKVVTQTLFFLSLYCLHRDALTTS